MEYDGKFSENIEDFLTKDCVEAGFEPTIPNLIEGLTEAKQVYSELVGEHRWWNDVLQVVRIGDKFVGYVWAENTGDNGIFDAGFVFDLSSVKFYEPKEVTITKYVEVSNA